MGDAKRLHVEPISSRTSRNAVELWHYSKRPVNNSQLHLGVFMDGRLLGVMAFGPPMDKRRMLGLVEGTQWENVCELNRMAFSDELPRNSESRALGVAFRLLRKHAPTIKWVVSFSDATQCGDGAIYRASGFLLTNIKRNDQIWMNDRGETIARMTATKAQYAAANGGKANTELLRRGGYRLMAGYQLRYVRFIDPTWVSRLRVDSIAFESIPDEVRMYRGHRAAVTVGDPAIPSPEDVRPDPAAPSIARNGGE